MSLRSRARALQQKTGLTYQQALQKLRALGERPARLRQQTNWPLEVCDRFLVDGHAPIDVVEVKPIVSLAERIEQICEELRLSANARAVLLTRDGRPVAHTGIGAARTEPGFTGMGLRSRARPLPELLELDAGIVLFTAELKPRALLVVKFQRDETSLGLVRLRVRRAVELLEPLLAEHATGMPPVGGGDGGSGAPSELRVVAPAPQKRRRKKP